MADFGSSLATWDLSAGKNARHLWTICAAYRLGLHRGLPLLRVTGDYRGAVEWVGKVAGHLDVAMSSAELPTITCESALKIDGSYDAIVTDPPYYDAIPYSDLADFFRVWLRRALWGFSNEFNENFREPLGPKWNAEEGDGELIDDFKPISAVTRQLRRRTLKMAWPRFFDVAMRS